MPRGDGLNKSKIGRPLKAIDAKVVERMALAGCPNTEIAAYCGCDEATIRNRFSDVVQKSRTELKEKLRQAQIKLALSGNATMQIWLGKQMLGQTDQQQMTHAGDMTFSLKVQTARDDG